MKCDTNKCCIYKGNNGKREKQETRDEINVGMDILDSNHSYFIHPVDSEDQIIDYKIMQNNG